MNSSRTISRREFVYLGVAGGLVIAGYPLVRGITSHRAGAPETELFKPTPTNTLGPFYKSGAPRRAKLTADGAAGTPLTVSGKIIDTHGTVLSNAKLEVFHSDEGGDYDMSGFNYRAEIPVAADGNYRYETIVPGQYGGRAQHIHYMITAPGHRRLITQLYFENDPKFGGNPDKNYTLDSLVEHRELIRPVTSVSKNNRAYTSVEFNLCLERT
jgi:protocatechuate 3,4-dioxygenase beta subunit